MSHPVIRQEESGQAVNLRSANRPVYEAVKRVLDLTTSGVALVFSLPFWLWAFAAVTLTDGWPFLYSQTRVGRNGRVFVIYKFRSMIKDAEKDGVPVYSEKRDPRVTRVGHIMRKTAIDEIPQLLSIIKGDLSWVGPRPARPEEVREYVRNIPNYNLRHTVRPGLTGFAQVYASDYENITEKLTYDLYYIRHRSLWLDLVLFIRSLANTLLVRWDKAR